MSYARWAVLIILVLLGSGMTPALCDEHSDADVRYAQELLSKRGYDPGPIDGLMGSKTAAALRRFQSDNALTQTGTLDAGTRRLLGIDRTGYTRRWTRDIPWGILPDWVYLLMLGSLAYIVLIGFRAFVLIRQRLGPRREGATLLALAIVAFMVIAFFSGGGGPFLVIGFALMVAVVGLGAMVLAALNAGRMLRRGGNHVILPVVLIIAGAAVNILPHPIGAVILMAIMVLTSWQGYYDRFDFLREAYEQIPALGYLLVWPPMAFLLTLSDLALLPFLLPAPFYGIAVTLLTVLAIMSGYRSA